MLDPSLCYRKANVETSCQELQSEYAILPLIFTLALNFYVIRFILNKMRQESLSVYG